MKLEKIMNCMKIFIWIKICLILVNIQIISDFMARHKEVTGKIKMEQKAFQLVSVVN